MPTPLEIRWNEVKYKLFAIQANLAFAFENKVWNEQKVPRSFKDGLRFATYLKFLLSLRNYPGYIQSAISKGNQIVNLFNQVGHQFNQGRLHNLRMMVLALEDSFWGENVMPPSLFVHMVLHQADPAREFDGSWIPHLFKQYLQP